VFGLGYHVVWDFGVVRDLVRVACSTVPTDISSGAGTTVRAEIPPRLPADTFQEFVAELRGRGVKCTAADIVRIGHDRSGRIVFWEKGNVDAGLIHIAQRHGSEFAKRGVSPDHLADFVWAAVTDGAPLGRQGSIRVVYKPARNDTVQHLSVDIGENGFIVGVNPTHSTIVRKLGK
jgi:hypothetical protein